MDDESTNTDLHAGSSESAIETGEDGGVYLVYQILDENGEKIYTMRTEQKPISELVTDSVDSAIQATILDSENDPLGAANESLSIQMSYVFTSTVVLIFAVFACIGAISVNTLMRSLEKRK